MIKKRSIWERTKIVTDALREGRKTWTELKNLGIPEKTLDRILNVYLGKELGLVTKSGEYWVWYDQIRTFQSKANYDLAIDHSRKLIPAFKTMVSMEGKDPTLLFAAVEHLKSYPDIYQKHIEFTSLFNERVKELLKKYGSMIKLPGRDFLLLDPVTTKRKGFLGKLGVTETGFRTNNPDYMIKWASKEPPPPAEMKEIDELRNLIDDTKVFNEKLEVYRQLAGDILLLIFKVEVGGTPLEGRCSLCPHIAIKD